MCVCVCVQDDLLAELEELEQEELDKDLLEIGGTEDVPLPSVPSTSLPSRPGDTHSHTHTISFLLTIVYVSRWLCSTDKVC